MIWVSSQTKLLLPLAAQNNISAQPDVIWTKMFFLECFTSGAEIRLLCPPPFVVTVLLHFLHIIIVFWNQTTFMKLNSSTVELGAMLLLLSATLLVAVHNRLMSWLGPSSFCEAQCFFFAPVTPSSLVKHMWYSCFACDESPKWVLIVCVTCCSATKEAPLRLQCWETLDFKSKHTCMMTPPQLLVPMMMKFPGNEW